MQTILDFLFIKCSYSYLHAVLNTFSKDLTQFRQYSVLPMNNSFFVLFQKQKERTCSRQASARLRRRSGSQVNNFIIILLIAHYRTFTKQPFFFMFYERNSPQLSLCSVRHFKYVCCGIYRRKTKEAAKPKEAKRKAPRQHKAKRSSWRVFDSDSEEEGTARPPQQLRSSYSKRVADGVVRRTAQLEGGLFLDLKLYQVDDIKNVHPLKRHEKAVLALKFRGEPDSPELAALQQLLQRCKAKFVEDGYFYGDKVDR